MTKRYSHTPLEEQRERMKEGKRYDIRNFFDLVPEIWEEKRKQIMDSQSLNDNKRQDQRVKSRRSIKWQKK